MKITYLALSALLSAAAGAPVDKDIKTTTKSSGSETAFMKKMLDDMADYYEAGAVYDPEYFEELTACMAKYDDELLPTSQDNAWKQMMAYFKSNGTDKDYMGKSDHWGGCIPGGDGSRCPEGPYSRSTPEVFGAEKMEIYEPCNYVSNVAYYRSVTRTCAYKWSVDDAQINSLKRTFATHAMGSAFWHGSHTYVGYSFDNNMIAVIAYLAHQISVQSLPGNSSVLKQLSSTPRTKNGIDVSEDLVRMFSEQPVPEWAEILDTADLPHVFFITFAALLSTIGGLLLPWFVNYFIIDKLAYAIIPTLPGASTADADFVVKEYLPELHTAIANVKLTHEDSKHIAYKFIGMIMKIIYAFLWQEFFIPLTWLYNDVGVGLGAKVMPDWNDLANRISGTPQTDDNVTTATNVYPGDSQCRGSSAHALWHEESANGLLEIVFLADFVNSILKTGNTTETEIII